MITVKFDKRQVDRLVKALGTKQKRLPTEIAIAVNATAKFVGREMNKEVRKELALPAAAIAKGIKTNARATETNASATVTLTKSSRIPLRDFGAKQDKRGVSYKISKSKGKRLIAGAFQGPTPTIMKASWRGRVFQRTGKGRLPIEQKYGPSSWGVFVKRKAEKRIRRLAKHDLKKRIERRISKLELKAKSKK